MTVSVSSYQLKTADFNEEQLKAILSYAVGFNPRQVKITLCQDDYSKVKLEEKTLGAFVNPGITNDEIIKEENVRYVTGQLDSWAGSKASGSLMAERAAELIRSLTERIKELENPSK